MNRHVMRIVLGLAVSVGGPAPGAVADVPGVFAEAAFEPAQGDVKAQSILRVRFYQSVSFEGLEISAPRIALAETRRIGPDRVTEAVRRGIRYRLTERRFAVFPFASGELRAGQVQITGVSGRGGAGNMSARARIELPDARLEVRPIPPGLDAGAWLPARAVTLTETWTPSLDQARVGEALLRTIRVEARGVEAAAIPVVKVDGAGFSAHAETPRLENRFENDWNIGTREQTWRIVPSGDGVLAISEVRLDWHDVADHQARIATLPARTVRIKAEAGPAQAGAEATNLRDHDNDARFPPGEIEMLGLWTFLAGATALLFAAIVGLWLRSDLQTWRPLRTACRQNDPKAARSALLGWARQRFPGAEIRSLADLERCVGDASVRAEIRAVDRALYGPPGAPWAGRSLLRAFPPPRLFSRVDGLPTVAWRHGWPVVGRRLGQVERNYREARG